MFELGVLVLFLALPFALDYWPASYVTAVLPAVALALSAIAYVNRTPTGGEVDVIPSVLLVAGVIAVTACVIGAAGARRRRG